MIANIPQIKEIVRLSDYAPEFGEDAVISVWVNPPQRLYTELSANFNGADQQITAELAMHIASMQHVALLDEKKPLSI